ncbi:GHKL domain-containing protein [Metasolibacillus meyeri]|uniref:GHKL domain-containing protein n=1 Tax=Metasolibacillus meyeri TaxID=1071052 RepID=A0AAW9NU74_9BACL|nr:GHKL domain-containing protein [Metasolibacillus meyeri]MEC1178561.1 GHKL domain-containing protein [Metasolibacillus meyeri]
MIQVSYLIVMVIIVGIFLYSVNTSYRAKKKVLEIEQFMQYMTALEEVNRDMQKFRHDYTNILLTIQGYLDQKDMEGLQSYFQQSIVQTGRQTLVKHQTLGRLDNLESVELKGLLATKILQTDALNIPAIIEIPRPVPMLQMSIVDIARVVGILMDNALEAVRELPEGNISVAIFPTDDEMVQLIIENSYGDTPPHIGKLFQQGYSTKGQGRGSGLTIAKAIIGSYPNAMMHTRVEDGKFIQELSIY